MGIACKINRNSSGNPVSVTTESGRKSQLFDAALNLTKDPKNALEVYATIFTQEFQDEVMNPAVRRAVESGIMPPLDRNGEPSLEMVTKYIGAKSREGKTLGFKEVLDLKEAMSNTPNFREKITDAFIKDGLFTVDRKKLLKSGLYNVAEANAILADQELQSKVQDTVEAFIESSDDMFGESPSYQIFGEQGAARIDKSQGVTTRMNNLIVAQEMQKEGKSAEEIKLLTGWQLGKEGKWRYEDQDIIHPDFLFMSREEFVSYIYKKQNEKGELLTIADLANPSVVESYPSLKEIKFSMDTFNPGYEGQYDPRNKRISWYSGSENSPASVITHEVQHVIQNEEGFAMGGNTSMFDWVRSREQLQFLAELVKEMKESGTTTVEAEEVVNPNNKFGLTVRELHYARAIAGSQVADVMLGLSESMLNTTFEANSFKNYKRLAGEVESRNVQERMELDMEERRMSLFEVTEDVDPIDQIVFLTNYDKIFLSHQNKVNRIVRPIISKLKQTGLATETYLMDNVEIAQKLQEIGVSTEVLDYMVKEAKVEAKPGFNEGIERVREEAIEYKIKKGIKSLDHPPVYTINKELSNEIAQAYEAMEHKPNDPKVKEAYQTMMEETLDQYDFILSKGIKVIRHEGKGEPYSSSREMLEDLENGQLKFLPNDDAFGTNTEAFSDNMGLQASGKELEDGYSMTNSEIFRVVHDYFGHGILGNQFGAIGEENATLQHAAMFSDKARPAMIAQTRGQNSWVNFSGANKEAKTLFKEARKLEKQGDTKKAQETREKAQKLFKFAEPKIGLLPEKYNFTKYETARRITEQREIDSRPTPEDNDLSDLLAGNVARSRSTRGVSRRSVRRTESIRGYDVDIVNEFELDERIDQGIKKAFPRFLGTQKIYEITNGGVYRELQIKSLEKNPFKASVTVHDAEGYNNMRMFITEDGSTGATLTKDGFLGRAFSDPTFNKPNNLPQLMVVGIKEGAITAEAFDTVLPDYYTNFGFKAVSRTAFNDEYKPMKANGALEDWDYEKYKRFNNGKPDVVFFIYDGGSRDTIEDRLGQFDSYKEYEKANTTPYDENNYDFAYRQMEVDAIKRNEFERRGDLNYQLGKAGITVIPNGFTYKGEVYLNTDKMGVDTPIHEFGHLWNNWAKSEAKVIYDQGITLMKEQGQEYVDFVKENQPHLKGEAIYEEALAQAIGDQGKMIVEEARKEGFTSWLKSLWRMLQGKLGISGYTVEEIMKMDARQFSRAIATDMLKGTKPRREFFTPDKDASSVNSLGMFRSENPHITEKNATQLLGGIQDRKEFESVLEESSFETLKDQYFSDPGFARDLFDEMQSYTRLREFKAQDGQLVRKMTNDVAEALENTLETEVYNGLNENILYLQTIPSDIWRYNGSDVTDILTEIREQAVDMGLNLVNLEDFYYERSQDELINLLETVKNVNLQPSKARFNELVSAYESFFDINKEASVKVQKVGEAHKGKTLIALDSHISEYEAFAKLSLLKVGEGVYQKVKKPESLEVLYSQLEDYQTQEWVHKNIPSVDSNEIDAVQLEMMTALKYSFNSNFNKEVTKDETKEQMRHNSFTGDVNYLKDQFVSDFNKDMIKEQQKGSEVYDDFYSNFEVGSKGIILKNNDPITMEKVRAYVESGILGTIGDNLVQYSILSKNSELDLVTESESNFKSDDFYRDYFVNNPTQATRIGSYAPLAKGVIAAKGSPKFVRTSEGVFEAIESVGEVNFYSQLPKTDPGYNKFGVSQPELGIDVTEYSYLQTIPVNGTKIKNKYTRIEEERINNEHFNCE